MNNVNHNFQILAQEQRTLRAEFFTMKTLIQAMVPRICEMGGKLGLDGFDPSLAQGITTNEPPRNYVTNEEVSAMIKRAVDDLRAEQAKSSVLQEANILDSTEKMAARVAIREVARMKHLTDTSAPVASSAAAPVEVSTKSKRKSKAASVVSIDDFIGPERAQTTEETVA